MASANHMTGLLELEQLQQQPGNCGRRASEAAAGGKQQQQQQCSRNRNWTGERSPCVLIAYLRSIGRKQERRGGAEDDKEKGVGHLGKVDTTWEQAQACNFGNVYLRTVVQEPEEREQDWENEHQVQK